MNDELKQSVAAGAFGFSAPSREKYWDELNSSEKIEKMAMGFGYLQKIVNSQAEVINKFQDHVHVSDRIFWGDKHFDSPYGWPNKNFLNRNTETSTPLLEGKLI